MGAEDSRRRLPLIIQNFPTNPREAAQAQGMISVPRVLYRRIRKKIISISRVPPKRIKSLRFVEDGLEMTALTTDNKEVGKPGQRQGKWPLFIMSSVTAFLASSSPTYKLVIHPRHPPPPPLGPFCHQRGSRYILRVSKCVPKFALNLNVVSAELPSRLSPYWLHVRVWP